MQHPNATSALISQFKEELGDLLLQVVFLSRLAEEKKWFDTGDVVQTLVDKLKRRHPHVFGEEEANTAEEVARLWEKVKNQERKSKANSKESPHSILDGVPTSMPALIRAQNIGAKAAANGFDWPSMDGVVDKIKEEWHEFNQALDQAESIQNSAAVRHEMGDLLFSFCNFSRFLSVSCETTLHEAIERFQKRFRCMEQLLKRQEKGVEDCDLQELNQLWETAKKKTRTSNDRKQ